MKGILRLTFRIAGIALILFLMWIAYGIYEGKKVVNKSEQQVRKYEATFRDNASLGGCLVLMDKYYWDYKDYEKAMYYADYCIKLNVSHTRKGPYVHLMLAKCTFETETY